MLRLRSSLGLMALMPPVSQSCRWMGRGRMWNTRRKPTFIEFNERRQIVEPDSMLKVSDIQFMEIRSDECCIRKAKWIYPGGPHTLTGITRLRSLLSR